MDHLADVTTLFTKERVATQKLDAYQLVTYWEEFRIMSNKKGEAKLQQIGENKL